MICALLKESIQCSRVPQVRTMHTETSDVLPEQKDGKCFSNLSSTEKKSIRFGATETQIPTMNADARHIPNTEVMCDWWRIVLRPRSPITIAPVLPLINMLSALISR